MGIGLPITIALPLAPGKIEISASKERDKGYTMPQKNDIEYHAINGQVFTATAWYYEIQEALMELSRQAYENDTSMDHIIIK